MENAGGDIRGIAKEIEQMLLCQLYVKDTKAALSRPVCLAYVVSKNWQELYRKNQFSTRSDICLSFD